jgi:hypothetical protein
VTDTHTDDIQLDTHKGDSVSDFVPTGFAVDEALHVFVLEAHEVTDFHVFHSILLVCWFGHLPLLR